MLQSLVVFEQSPAFSLGPANCVVVLCAPLTSRKGSRRLKRKPKRAKQQFSSPSRQRSGLQEHPQGKFTWDAGFPPFLFSKNTQQTSSTAGCWWLHSACGSTCLFPFCDAVPLRCGGRTSLAKCSPSGDRGGPRVPRSQRFLSDPVCRPGKGCPALHFLGSVPFGLMTYDKALCVLFV